VGTASLVFGFLAIGFAVVLEYEALTKADIISDDAFLIDFFGGIIFFAIGGLLLRKYDKDKKKEKID